MDERDDSVRDGLEIEPVDGIDGDGGRRTDGLDDLRDRLDRIESAISRMTDMLGEIRTTARAVAIDNGAEVRYADDDRNTDIADDVVVIPDFDELDLDL